jgi:hypothetical protein
MANILLQAETSSLETSSLETSSLEQPIFENEILEIEEEDEIETKSKSKKAIKQNKKNKKHKVRHSWEEKHNSHNTYITKRFRRIDFISQVNECLYKNMKNLIVELLHGGSIIFGGCPRDAIIKNYYNNLFYEFCKQYPNSLDIYNKQYNNIKCHPESYEGRNTLPKDIDCFISQSSFNKLKDLFSKKGFTFKWKKDNVTLKYFKSIPDAFIDKLKHSSCTLRSEISSEINSFMRILCNYEAIHIIKSKTKFDIDFIIYQDENPVDFIDFITPGLDFTANSIYMSKDIEGNINFKTVVKQRKKYINMFDPEFYYKSQMEDLEFIMKQIYKKETDVKNLKVDGYRINKLVRKGWKLSFEDIIFTYNSLCETYLEKFIPNSDDECIICRANLNIASDTEDITGIIVRHKICECKVGFHLLCYATYYDSTFSRGQDTIKCAHCRTVHTKHSVDINQLFSNIIDYNTLRREYIDEHK